jgi:hypothetical protein
VGDALGAPVEFMKRTEILRRFGSPPAITTGRQDGSVHSCSVDHGRPTRTSRSAQICKREPTWCFALALPCCQRLFGTQRMSFTDGAGNITVQIDPCGARLAAFQIAFNAGVAAESATDVAPRNAAGCDDVPCYANLQRPALCFRDGEASWPAFGQCGNNLRCLVGGFVVHVGLLSVSSIPLTY